MGQIKNAAGPPASDRHAEIPAGSKVHNLEALQMMKVQCATVWPWSRRGCRRPSWAVCMSEFGRGLVADAGWLGLFGHVTKSRATVS